ncbi:MAG TPA: TonB family protein [Sphingomicrobium sp.]|nr:TonB family protein [Sphingomicrobium sp.]
MAYQAADNPDRIKALIGVLIVHAALAAAILSGLNVEPVTTTIERLRTFEITEPPPPPPPLSLASERARDKEGAAARKALPTPVVAPQPRIEIPSQPTVTAAPVPSTGSAATAGAAADGTGTGAGGSGTGAGGGGRGGDGAGFTPAQRISKIPNREYRRFVAASGARRGTVGITVKVNTDGRLSNCRVIRSSGNPGVDALMCSLTLQNVRFRPARDPQGRPVAQDITWYPDWAPNR